MKSAIVSIEDIHANNPRLCLSPLRYVGKCWKCPNYLSKTGTPCNSRVITEEGETKRRALKETREKIANLTTELEKLKPEEAL